MKMFIRTCQECWHQQEAKDPLGRPSDRYMNAKCRKCRSEALDYGSWREVGEEHEHDVP